MTQKHFIALADMLKRERPADDAGIGATEEEMNIHVGKTVMWRTLRDSLADVCGHANPKFKRSVFLGYINGTCGKLGGRL